MAKLIASRPSDLKMANKKAIVQHVYRSGVTSKPDICNTLGLSKPTASSLIDELVAEGILRSVGFGSSTDQGGKRPELFDFNDNAGYCLGLHIGLEHVYCILTNLRLKACKKISLPIPEKDFTSVFDVISKMAGRLMETAALSGLRVLGIGVSSPGTVDPVQGVILHTVYPDKWLQVPLGDSLEKKFNLPVIVDNESRNIALAEKWFGIGKTDGVSSFITLQTENGLGTGVVLGGSTALSPGYSAGQFGHTTINFDGPLCKCGNRGCWELYATEQAFIDAVRRGVNKWGLPSLFIEDLKLGTELSLTLIAQYYQAGDEFVRTQVEQYVKLLSVGIVNLVNAFSPEWIVLHGNLSVFGAAFLDLLTSIVRVMALPPASEHVCIVYSSLGQNPGVLGASTAVVRAAIEDWSIF